MKKTLTLLLSALLALSLAACGSGSGKTSGPSAVRDPLDLLTTVWNSYADDEKFPAAGGDMTEENAVMDAPGRFGLDDTEILDSTLGFPAAKADSLSGAASLMHMMNATTFTCGAYEAKNADETADLAAAVKDNILQRQWMCGFPDKLVIVTIDQYIVAFFGENAIMDTFQDKLMEAYPSAQIVCDEPIA